MKRGVLLLFSCIFLFDCLAENTDSLRIADIREKMDSLCIIEPAFGHSVDISVGQMKLSELLRTVAQIRKVNLSVRDNFDCIVSCNFTQSRIDDLLVFLCREYDLDIDVFGNIVSIFRYMPAEKISPPLVLDYSPTDSLISFNLYDKPLSDVAENIMSKTGKNIIVPKELRSMTVSASAINVPLSDAMSIIAGANGLEFFLTQGKKELWCFAKRSDIESFSVRRQNKPLAESTDTSLVFPLHHRSVSNIRELIPEQMTKNITILSSDEMNSLIVYGTKHQVRLLENFISGIDVTIPLVSIDIMIVETTKRFSRNVGLKVGKNIIPTETTAVFGQGTDVVIGSSVITSLLEKIDGFSNVNLGDVADNLYIELKLLENRGDIKLESTPKLATLNGHKASMSKGETIYYKEINTSYLGSQNPLQTSSYNWKNVDADLTIDITPHVSLDSLITLDVELSQSEFGTAKEENAPPPITKRSFKSIVRVSDGDVVLLGGLDSCGDSISRDGLPWIARVPVLRWIFGVQRREKSDSKMSVFIRAEIID